LTAGDASDRDSPRRLDELDRQKEGEAGHLRLGASTFNTLPPTQQFYIYQNLWTRPTFVV
jgi:hypothetical protein